MVLLSIALGGALGALARHGLTLWVYAWAGGRFPWGTFVVNALGCLLIGFFLRSLQDPAWAPEARAFLVTGLIGAFTTFSTYSYETWALIQGGEWLRATSYSLGSVGLGLVAVGVGVGLAQLLLGRP